MKKWLLALVASISMLGCHPAGAPAVSQDQMINSDTIGNIITVVGKAENAKIGAHLTTDTNGYYIDQLGAWPDSLLGRTVEATGRLKTVTHREEDLVNRRGEVSQGMVGEQLILEEATWRLKE